MTLELASCGVVGSSAGTRDMPRTGIPIKSESTFGLFNYIDRFLSSPLPQLLNLYLTYPLGDRAFRLSLCISDKLPNDHRKVTTEWGGGSEWEVVILAQGALHVVRHL